MVCYMTQLSVSVPVSGNVDHNVNRYHAMINVQ